MSPPLTCLALAINLLLWFESSSAKPTNRTSPAIDKRSPPNTDDQILHLICSKSPSKAFWNGIPALKPPVAEPAWANYESRDVPRTPVDKRTSIVAHKELEGAIRCGRRYFKNSWETHSRFYIYRIRRGPEDFDTAEFPGDDRVETRWQWDFSRIIDATWFSLGKRLMWTTQSSDLKPLLEHLSNGIWQQNPNIQMLDKASASSALRELALRPANAPSAQEPWPRQDLPEYQLPQQQTQDSDPKENLYIYTVGALFPMVCFRSGIPATISHDRSQPQAGLFEVIPDSNGDSAVVAYETKKDALVGFIRSHKGKTARSTFHRKRLLIEYNRLWFGCGQLP
ncbi:hypothetical protein GQ602_000412 [Ophiocordyceps camponoti-floridani]|uniref:Uncharacterized protein n=1 Tax=Ophiocordyceps camponoti-floridani TaxID=2030778 RepID=A0A8H4QC44_9HYPO|nr:hypothetical protein GQ602_000412 [Ophiocordyceps camponoti-floridani]